MALLAPVLTPHGRLLLAEADDAPAVVQVDQTGVARLELVAWSSFTVGAEVDAGRTKLELDLAQVPDTPPRFRLM